MENLTANKISLQIRLSYRGLQQHLVHFLCEELEFSLSDCFDGPCSFLNGACCSYMLQCQRLWIRNSHCVFAVALEKS
jgi:hypothetical protein